MLTDQDYANMERARKAIALHEAREKPNIPVRFRGSRATTKPRIQVGEMAAKRGRCQQQKEAGLPCQEFQPTLTPPTLPEKKGEGKQVERLLPNPPKAVSWAYGVTTVPERRDSLLPKTLVSLEAAGFDEPRLFVDGAEKHDTRWNHTGFEVTLRSPRIRTYGNWLLALLELYIREPHAERYAIFQDDLLASANLRAYLDACPFPPKGYLNLYTFPVNEQVAPQGGGWYEAAGMKGGHDYAGPGKKDQLGRSALALVFNRDGVLALLGSQHVLLRPQNPQRGHEAVDGGVVVAMNKAGYREWVHTPCLLQHTGLESTRGPWKFPQSQTWRGENFDCLDLLTKG